MLWNSPWEAGASPPPRPGRPRDPYEPPRSAPAPDPWLSPPPPPAHHHHAIAAAYPSPPPLSPPPGRDRVVAVAELPSALRPAFRFRFFNLVQSDCFDAAFGSDAPLVVAAPTGAGKTGVLELALARRLLAPPPGALPAKALYLAPSRALCQERLADWRTRFGPLGVTVAELTGDADADRVGAARLVCVTPEKLDAVTRGRGPRGAAAFVGDVGLVMIDEVHLLGDVQRGATLEAVVARLKTIGAATRMAGTPLTSARYVAVSATLPNAGDVGAWLGAGADVRVFGDEVRPVPLDLHVRAYPPTHTDFLFDKKLDDHLPAVMGQYAAGRPALVFCASRKGAEATARALAARGPARRAAMAPAAVAALDAAAARVAGRGLADALRAGAAFHHAGLDAGDRGAVEALFLGRGLPVLCTTSTLATGVNLPAYLVVVKGTRRWTNEPGCPPGFQDYAPADILQMLGRAGRPQFDDHGIGVVMTRQGPSATELASLVGGAGAPLASRLADPLADHLNAEVVLRTVTDVEGAAAWFKRTFMWARIAADPAAAGFPADAPPDALERLAVQRHVSAALAALTAAGLVRADPGGTGLTPLPPGVAAARHYVRLATVATLRAVPAHASLPDLLDAVVRAAELKDVPLRRGERKPLAALNRASGGLGLPTVGGGGACARVATPADKLFVLAVDGASPKPGVGLDYSMRREAETVARVGARVAECGAAVFRNERHFAAAANAVRLERVLRTGAWHGTDAEVQQLRGVGEALGARLAGAGLGRLAALRAADARRVELATGRAFPFGSELLADAASLAPPDLTLTVAGVAWRLGGRLDAAVTLTRVAPPPPRGDRRPPYGVLIVGTPADDDLLLFERVALDSFPSPYTVRVAPRGGAPVTVVAALLPERVVGADVVASAKFVAGMEFGKEDEAAEAATAAPSPAASPLAPSVPPCPAAVASAVPCVGEGEAAAAPRAALSPARPPPAKRAAAATVFDQFRLTTPRKLGAAVAEEGGHAASVRRETGDAAAAAAAAEAPRNEGAGAGEAEYADIFSFL